VLQTRWLVADSGYGRDPKLRAFFHEQAIAYVLAVPVDLPLVGVRGEASRPDALLADTATVAWQRRSAGHDARPDTAQGRTLLVLGRAPGHRQGPTAGARVHPHPAHPPGHHGEGHYETPPISMLAHAFLAVTRANLGKDHEDLPAQASGGHTRLIAYTLAAIRTLLAATVLARTTVDKRRPHPARTPGWL
jgi:hypothetical protein